MPVAGVASDGQTPIRNAVARALPGVPHRLCHFHYLREAAAPIYEADRPAKAQLKKAVRGVRPIEQAVEGRGDADAQAVRGYRAAVRSALTDDGRPSPEASGLRLRERLAKVAASLDRAGAARRGGAPEGAEAVAGHTGGRAERDRRAVAGVEAGFGWLRRAAAVLGNATGSGAAAVRRRYAGRPGAVRRHRSGCGALGAAVGRFAKVSRSYWRGPFRCYDVADLPQTNNDLEQFFGSYRYHERRCGGRKVARPGTVVRGRVRLVASAASRLRAVGAENLIPADVPAWRALRAELGRRRATRALGRRFRHDPEAYLHELEEAIRNTLPA